MERITVKSFLDSLFHKMEPPLVSTESSLKEVVRSVVKGHRHRVVYVIDARKRLKGAISLDILKDVVFHHYLDDRVTDALVLTEHTIELFASEKAADFMDADLVCCRHDERLQDVVSRMIERNVTQVPVLDHKERVVGELDILDLFELWLKVGQEALR